MCPRGAIWHGGAVLDLSKLDLDDIASALRDNSYEHRWLIDPATGEIRFVSDWDPPEDLDDTNLVSIEPIPTREWYQDMADFIDEIPDERAAMRLARAIRGRGAFRRFRDELYNGYPELVTLWNQFSDRRALRRAVEWLLDSSLVDDDDAERFLAEHPDIDLGAA
jgi:hypothetical protein